jgi:glycosyltransferase involved in cell wall biosynthesis
VIDNTAMLPCDPGVATPNTMKIILDCDLMKHRDSGLFYYCLNLGKSVRDILLEQGSGRISYYVPESAKDAFGEEAPVIADKRSFWNYFRPFLKGCQVWHAPFQSGRIIPDKKRNPGVRVLLTIHDLNPLHEGKTAEEQRQSLAHTQGLIDRSDAIVCISEFCRSDVLAHCDTGNKPVRVIHNGTHQVIPGRINGSAYKPQRPFLFGLGYVNTKKNFHVLIPLLREDESIEIVIAGKLDEPDYIFRMKEEAARQGVAERLHIVGPVSEEEKGWYFEHCMAYVHPSLAEGFGAPVVEAMQFGKPLFLSPLTSLPEIAADTAFYFPGFEHSHITSTFREGMELYQKDREGLSERIRERGKLYNWRTQAQQYIEMYKLLYGS